MKRCGWFLAVGIAWLIGLAGCGSDGSTSGGGSPGSAVVLGQFSSVSTLGSTQVAAEADAGVCPDVVVSINGTPATIEFTETCDFLISEVPAAEQVVITVELPGAGIAGSIELADVAEGEIIEILVAPGVDALSIAVVRRSEPEPDGILPEVITENNLGLSLPAGFFDQDLTVLGNRFSLTGEAGETCTPPTENGVGEEEGWTTIGGTVQIDGNAAIFRNIKFLGQVTVFGNATRFINCCFGNEILVFGNRPVDDKEKVPGKGTEDDDDEEEEDDGEDQDDD